MVAILVGTFTQFALGALGPFLAVDLELSRAQLGMITTVMFVAGGLLSPVAGSLSDRVGGRPLVLALLAAAGCSWVAMASTRSLAGVVLAVLPAGWALAVSNPATNQLVLQHAAYRQRGLLVGFKQAGGSLAALMAGLGLPPLAAALGWRAALLICAVLGGLALVAAAVFLPRARMAASAPSADPTQSHVAGWRGEVAWLAAYALAMGLALAPTFAYLPLFALEEVGLSPVQAGRSLSVMAVVSIPALILWGRLVDVTGPFRALGLIAVLAAGAQWLVLAAGPERSWLLWAGAAGLGASSIAWFAVGMAMIVRRVAPGSVGAASAFVFVAYYAGVILSPIPFGLAVDVRGDYRASWLAVLAVYLVAGALVAARGRVSSRRQSTCSAEV